MHHELVVAGVGDNQVTGLEAEIRNFILLSESGGPVTALGLRFTDRRTPSRDGYLSLIRDCLLSLQGQKP